MIHPSIDAPSGACTRFGRSAHYPKRRSISTISASITRELDLTRGVAGTSVRVLEPDSRATAERGITTTKVSFNGGDLPVVISARGRFLQTMAFEWNLYLLSRVPG